MAVHKGYVKENFIKEIEHVNKYLEDLCRKTLFKKVRQGFRGIHKMPCWRKNTKPEELRP
jgi:hypothetical protein